MGNATCETTEYVTKRQAEGLHEDKVYPSVFQPGFREWLPGVPPKQTWIAWNETSNHSSMQL